MKKIFSLFAAAMMTVVLFAEPRTFSGTEVLYLNASAVGWWQNGNAVQIATFDETVKVVGVPAADPTKVGFTVPAGSYYNVAFSRHETADSPAWNSTGAISLEGTTENMVNTFAENSTEATWANYDGAALEKPECPAQLYMLGNIENVGWDPTAAMAMTKSGEQFTATATFVADGTNEVCYFCFSAANTDWDAVNAARFGSKEQIMPGEAGAELNYPGEVTATIAPGTYTITVDWSTMTVSAVAASTGLNNAEAQKTVYKMVKDGRVVIMNNGSCYSVSGARE